MEIIVTMKYIFYFFLIFSMSLNAQQKDNIIFEFENKKDSLIETNIEIIFKINNEHSFRFNKNKHEKIDVKFDSIKDKFTSYDSFLILNNGKKYPEYF